MSPSKKIRSPRDRLRHTMIYLWRHPQTVGHAAGKFWGHSDVALSSLGNKQKKAVAKYMSRIKLDAVFSSDLQRAQTVAQAVGRNQHPRRVVTKIPELRELDLGDWEGMTYEEINKKDPGGLEARMADLSGFRIPGGESLEELRERALPAFKSLVDENFGGRLCIVAHAGVNRVILCSLLGAPLDRVFRMEQDYACLNTIQVFEDGMPVIKSVNYTLDVKE